MIGYGGCFWSSYSALSTDGIQTEESFEVQPDLKQTETTSEDGSESGSLFRKWGTRVCIFRLKLCFGLSAETNWFTLSRPKVSSLNPPWVTWGWPESVCGFLKKHTFLFTYFIENILLKVWLLCDFFLLLYICIFSDLYSRAIYVLKIWYLRNGISKSWN